MSGLASELIPAAPAVWQALLGIYALLIGATAIVRRLDRSGSQAAGTGRELALRVRSWWFIVTIFAVAMLLSPTTSAIFLAFVAYLALKEYFSLVPTRRIDREVLLWVYLAIPLQFYWAHSGWYGMFIIFIPVWMFLLLPAVMVLRGVTDGFLRAIGTLSWGLMITVFTLSHLAFLLTRGDAVNPGAGGAGLLLFLVFATQFNDVAQFVWGRTLGRRKVTPSVSPNKTWEGLIGGIATTTLLAALVGPWLTMMDAATSALAGAMVALAGFLGDVTISAVKRDLKVKDSGGLIPGHGGILDRVDSLTYAAPVFFHFVTYFYT
ncbi:MAG: phosphatidate cytidylyltransferase [Alphaproteobacteria bacterium]|jgi:phosphatidate cytidylyltransferase